MSKDMRILSVVGSRENHFAAGAFRTGDFLRSECKQLWIVQTRRSHSHRTALDGDWRDRVLFTGGPEGGSVDVNSLPVEGLCFDVAVPQGWVTQENWGGGAYCGLSWQLCVPALSWLSAFRRRVELHLAWWSPQGHFSAWDWKGFKGLEFTSLRTLICLRTTGKVYLENIYINPSAYPSCFISERYSNSKAHFVFSFININSAQNMWFGFFSSLCSFNLVIFCRTSLL